MTMDIVLTLCAPAPEPQFQTPPQSGLSSALNHMTWPHWMASQPQIIHKHVSVQYNNLFLVLFSVKAPLSHTMHKDMLKSQDITLNIYFSTRTKMNASNQLILLFIWLWSISWPVSTRYFCFSSTTWIHIHILIYIAVKLIVHSTKISHTATNANKVVSIYMHTV